MRCIAGCSEGVLFIASLPEEGSGTNLLENVMTEGNRSSKFLASFGVLGSINALKRRQHARSLPQKSTENFQADQ